MRKILYSPGFGAGWSSWISAPPKFVCEYQPIIDAIERGEDLSPSHPAVVQFADECKERYGTDPYLGGLEDLRIHAVDDGVMVRIDEYDGSESVVVGTGDYF
jgi:hypothetical protein